MRLKYFHEKGDQVAKKGVVDRDTLTESLKFFSEFSRLSLRFLLTMNNIGVELNHHAVLESAPRWVHTLFENLSEMLGKNPEFLTDEINKTWHFLWRYEKIKFAQGLYGIGPAVYGIELPDKEQAQLLFDILSSKEAKSVLDDGNEFAATVNGILKVEMDSAEAAGDAKRIKMLKMLQNATVNYFGLMDENAPKGRVPEKIKKEASMRKLRAGGLEDVAMHEIDGKFFIVWYTKKLNTEETMKLVAIIMLRAAREYMKLIEAKQYRVERAGALREVASMNDYKDLENQFFKRDIGNKSYVRMEKAVALLYEKSRADEGISEEERTDKIKDLESKLADYMLVEKYKEHIRDISVLQMVQFLSDSQQIKSI